MHLSCLGPTCCVFSSWVSSGCTMGVTAVWWLLDGGHSLFPPCVLSGLTVGGWLLSLMAQNPLLIEMAGSILFLTPNISFTLGPHSNYSECVKKKYWCTGFNLHQFKSESWVELMSTGIFYLRVRRFQLKRKNKEPMGDSNVQPGLRTSFTLFLEKVHWPIAPQCDRR